MGKGSPITWGQPPSLAVWTQSHVQMLQWSRQLPRIFRPKSFLARKYTQAFNYRPMEVTEQTRKDDGGRGQDMRKRPAQGGRGPKRQRTRKEKPAKEGDEVFACRCSGSLRKAEAHRYTQKRIARCFRQPSQRGVAH